MRKIIHKDVFVLIFTKDISNCFIVTKILNKDRYNNDVTNVMGSP